MALSDQNTQNDNNVTVFDKFRVAPPMRMTLITYP